MYSTAAQANKGLMPQAWNLAQKSIQPRFGPLHSVGGTGMGLKRPNRGMGVPSASVGWRMVGRTPGTSKTRGGGTVFPWCFPLVGWDYGQKGLLLLGHLFPTQFFVYDCWWTWDIWEAIRKPGNSSSGVPQLLRFLGSLLLLSNFQRFLKLVYCVKAFW